MAAQDRGVRQRQHDRNLPKGLTSHPMSPRFRTVAVMLTVGIAGAVLDRLGAPLTNVLAWGPVSRVVIDAAMLAVSLGIVVWLAVLRPLRRTLDEHQRVIADRQVELEEALSQQAFDNQLVRAFDLAEDESDARAVIGRALPLVARGHHAQFKLADDERGEIATIASAGDAPLADQCAVVEAGQCPAVRRGRLMAFSGGSTLDTCTALGDDSSPSVCLPVSVLGRSVGVLRVAETGDGPLEVGTRLRMEALSAHSSARLTMLRALARSESQAATDPLTGLLNRREFEFQFDSLVARELPVSLAMFDLDHFKALNDTHGHRTGDEALRCFADVLRDGFRPGDVVARHGGEEFVVVMVGAGLADAVDAVDRLRATLADVVDRRDLPTFTFSAGVAQTESPLVLDSLLHDADSALLAAKRFGRARTMTADDLVMSSRDEDGARNPDDPDLVVLPESARAEQRAFRAQSN